MAKVMNSTDDGLYSSEPPRTKGEAFKAFLYDPSTGAVFGRTGDMWAKLLLFYTIFYVILAVFCATCMWLFLLTISDDGPKWYKEDSVIGTSPGLGYRPMNKYNEDSSLIWYNVVKIDYKTKTSASNVVDCDYNKKPGKGQVCKVDINSWNPCISSKNFDYPNGRPCVFIKLNKILKWEPDYYDNPNALPGNMPKDLKKYIKEIKNTKPETMKTVWVSCQGEHPSDKENIGEIEYFPRRGFPGYYYPFERVDNYLSPLIALHFKSITKGVLVNVECRAWAKNIEHDRRERIGMVHFELLVDHYSP
ncbi:hypothetical protein L9F63_011323 [Diploptera punctata]|uniref:Sodium/potassium-transporting ATPase subunit beta-2 n=1 Tax=Diploptera punctata TaxID=6984 RepID=A0AAD8AEU3_DIPPU|nr:hypothetical protein L9F63_011323 [Diploptera punctata]